MSVLDTVARCGDVTPFVGTVSPAMGPDVIDALARGLFDSVDCTADIFDDQIDIETTIAFVGQHYDAVLSVFTEQPRKLTPWAILRELNQHSMDETSDTKEEVFEHLDLLASYMIAQMTATFGQANCDFVSASCRGLSPLHYAVRHSGARATNAICLFGNASFEETDVDVMYDLAQANVQVMRYISRNMQSARYELVNRRVAGGGTALHFVCGDTTRRPRELASCVRNLLRLGVDPTLLNDDQVSPRRLLLSVRDAEDSMMIARAAAMLEAAEAPQLHVSGSGKRLSRIKL